ncbi:hypothetical protein TNCV_956171 [Trichonephila clavipes]|nr:hypothetical protein TNCV_956171 [Trichonephila clavipes]
MHSWLACQEFEPNTVLSTPDSRALLTWFGDERSPFKDSVQSIDLLRKIEPLQFFLASPTVHLVRKDFSKTAGNAGEVERGAPLTECRYILSERDCRFPARVEIPINFIKWNSAGLEISNPRLSLEDSSEFCPGICR